MAFLGNMLQPAPASPGAPASAGPTSTGAGPTANAVTQANARTIGGADQVGSVSSIPNTASAMMTNPIGTAGNTMQGIGQAFTAQNQYNAQLAPQMQSNYGGVIDQSSGQALSGYQQYLNNQAQQQALINAMIGQSGQIEQVAQGKGPNPAMAQLANTTGQNVANQAALMAGQRGSSQNSGLIARQAAQQGANTQQQAVGQGSALQAQQQLAAMGQLQQQGVNIGNQMTNMGQQTLGEQGVNTQLFGTAAGAQNAQNANNINNYAMAQGINANVAQNNANAVNKTTGGLMNSAGSVAAMFMKDGGEVKKPKAMMADGGSPAIANPQSFMNLTANPGGVGVDMPSVGGGSKGASPMSNVGKFLGGSKGTAPTETPMPTAGDWATWAQTPQGSVPSSEANYSMMQNMANSPSVPDTSLAQAGPMSSMGPSVLMQAKGGEVPALVSPGEVYLSPKKVKEVAAKGNKPGDALKKGEKIPGKAKVKGDSYANDTVSKTLKEGGIVLPRHVTESDDAPQAAARFVQAIIAKRGLKKGLK